MGLSGGPRGDRGRPLTAAGFLTRRLIGALAGWRRSCGRRRQRRAVAPIAAALLGIVIFSALGLMIERHQVHRLQEVAFSRSTFEAAAAEVQFARALTSYIKNQNPAGQPGYDYNTQISITTLQTAGYLPPGYQMNNMFGQRIVGYLGAGGVGLVTYVGQPDAATLSRYGVDVSSNANLTSSLMLNPEMMGEARDAAVVAVQDPQLICGIIQNEKFQGLANGYTRQVDALGISAQALRYDPDYHAAILVNAVPNQTQNGAGAATYNGFTPD